MNYQKKEQFQAELLLLKNRERHPFLHYLLRYLRNDRFILDLGCGLLVNSYYIKDNGFPVVGVDISLDMLKEKNKKDIPLTCAQGLRLPFKKDSFEGIVLVDIIEHLPREQVNEFLEEVKRVSQEHGVIFFHVPLERSLIYRILSTFKLIWPKNPNHLHDYNLNELINIIKENNYTVLWEHKENGISYYLRHYLSKIRLSIMVAKLTGNFLQNFFAASYTACLGFRSDSDE